MRVWLDSLNISLLLFLGITAMFLVPWVRHLYVRYGKFRSLAGALSAAFGLYVCALVGFTLFPLPDEQSIQACTDWLGRAQLTVGGSLSEMAGVFSERGIVSGFLSTTFLQIAFNIVFFVPLGMFCAYRWSRGIISTGFIGLGVSLAIEITQGTALWWLYPCPYRLADVDDLILNTSGALLGWVAIVVVRKKLPPLSLAFVPSVSAVPTQLRVVLGELLNLYTVIFVQVFVTAGVLFFEIVVTGDFAKLPVTSAGWYPYALSTFVTLLLMFVIPMMRKDKSGPGIHAVAIKPLTLDKMGQQRPLTTQSLFYRWCVRWIPFILFGTVGFVLSLVIDLVVQRIAASHRSLSDSLSSSTYIVEGTKLSSTLN